MITYEMQADGTMGVRLDGRKVGEIRLTFGGFRYFPTHGKPGEKFPTMAKCKESLEAH